MSPWIPVRDISLAAGGTNGASRADSQSRCGCPTSPSGYRRTGDGWKFTERRYEVRYHDQSPQAGSGSGPSLTSGHFSFRFVICALAAREMPETAE